MELCQDLAEGLYKTKDSLEKLADYLREVNIDRRKFEFSGKVLNNSVPDIIFSEELIEGDMEKYMFEQINRYVCDLNLSQDSVFRTQPWLKVSQNCHKEDYKRFDLTGCAFPNNKFFDIPVKFIEAEYRSNMLVPKELWMLFHLSFSFISNVFGFIREGNKAYLVIEEYNKKLDEIIGVIEREEIISLVKQLVSVTEILHYKKVVKFSLRNIEIDDDGCIKVWDFSDAELLVSEDQQEKQDLLKLGQILKEIVNRKGFEIGDPLVDLSEKLSTQEMKLNEVLNFLEEII